jgi:hypothetical protein
VLVVALSYVWAIFSCLRCDCSLLMGRVKREIRTCYTRGFVVGSIAVGCKGMGRRVYDVDAG